MKEPALATMFRAILIGLFLGLIGNAVLASQYQIPQSIDQNLVGQWRHTSGQYDGGFSMTTDTFYTLNSDGTFVWRARTVGSAGESNSGPEYGQWRAGNGRLFTKFDGDEVSSTAYQLGSEGLFLPEEKHFRLWERTR